VSSIRRSTRSRLAERLAYLYRHDVATPLAGTVTTDGTTTIAGAGGTAFTTDFSAGDSIWIAGELEPLIVDSVTDNDTLVTTTAATTTAGGKAYANSQGLFERLGGAIGSGSIDSPQAAARIQVWPVEALAATLLDAPYIMIQAVRPSGVFGMLPSGFAQPVYEIMATLYIRTQPEQLVDGELNSDDIFLHMRDVAIKGENQYVPGKLMDPDDTDNALNIHLSAMNEETPQRFRDVTLYPLRLAYTCNENARTGALI